MVISVQERCRIAPRGGADAPPEKTLRLTYMDMPYLHFRPCQRLLFYRFPTSCSTSSFYATIVPNLKNSLSETLRHYFPLAGGLYFPESATSGLLPELRYVPGDSISFIVAESSSSSKDLDFNYLTGNKARDADLFYALVPNELSENSNTETTNNELSGNFKRISSLLSAQVTLFPENGICIGFANHHAVGDVSTIVGFLKAWSATARSEAEAGAEELGDDHLQPFYDRSVIKDPNERLANLCWNDLKNLKFGPRPQILPTNKVRGTFVMSKDDIQSLRNWVLGKKPQLTHLSPFTITTAYVWSCLAKAAAEIGEGVNNEEPEYYMTPVNARPRLNPPVPATYFGNCLAYAMTELKHGELKSGEFGFLNAVEGASKLISEKVHKEGELMKDVDDWNNIYPPLFRKRIFYMAGSPKFDLYDNTDFGWGKPVKYEYLIIDGEGSISVSKSREFEGGLEVGLSVPNKKMEAFEAIFYGGLFKI